MPTKIYSQSSFWKGSQRGSADISSTFFKKQVLEQSLLTEPFISPLIQWLYLNKNVDVIEVTHPEGLYEGVERELIPTAMPVSVYSLGGTSDSVLTIVDAELVKRCQLGTRLKLSGTDETGTVTAISSNETTVKRDLNSSGAVQGWTDDFGNSEFVYIIGKALGEKAYPTDSVFLDPFFHSSRTQISQDRIDFTERMIGSTMKGGTYGGDWFQNRMMDLIKERKILKEKTFWENENHFKDTINGDLVTVTQGVVWTIRNYGGTVGTYAGTYPTEQELDTFFESINRGSYKKTFFCGYNLMSGIMRIMKSRWQIDKPIARYSILASTDAVKVMEYQTHNMLVEIIGCPTWEGTAWRNRGVLLDDNNIARLQQCPDDKGARMERIEPILYENGKGFKGVKILDDSGVYVKKPATCAIFEKSS